MVRNTTRAYDTNGVASGICLSVWLPETVPETERKRGLEKYVEYRKRKDFRMAAFYLGCQVS